MKYFRLRDDVHFPRRWYLGDVKDFDNWEALTSKLADPHRVQEVEIYQDGDEMDFTLTEMYGVPIVSSRLRNAFGDLPGVRFFPIKVAGKIVSESYFVMLIESIVDGVDESRSQFEKFVVGDPIRPDKPGHYKWFFKLVVDEPKAMASGWPIFRLAKFELAIIVNGDIKQIIENIGARGADVEDVSPVAPVPPSKLRFLVLPPAAREEQVHRLLQSANQELAARALGVIPGMLSEKSTLAERIIERDAASPDLLPLIRHLAPSRLADLAAAHVDHLGRGELLLEIARHAPGAVRPLVAMDKINDARALAAARADAPNEWVDRLREAYERTHDLGHVRAIGQVRTDRARSALITISKSAPDEHLGAIALALENCGVFPDSRHPSIYFHAYRGYVVSRGESPHHTGAGLGLAVPMCPFCQTPAERLLTLSAEALGPTFKLELDPSYFWYRCSCGDNGDHILVRHTDAGLVGVMTAMTDGPERYRSLHNPCR